MTAEESGFDQHPSNKLSEPIVPAGGELPPPLSLSREPASVRLYLDRREGLEQEFIEVKRVGIFYAAMLGPLLGLIGWVYHTQADPFVAEYWGAGILYGVIVAFAWVWRDELRRKLSWPKDVSAQIWTVAALTPFLTVTCAYFASIGLRRLGVPESNQHLLAESWPAWFCYVWNAVIPAFFEEVAFRGLLFTKLKRMMSPVQAGWVTAIMFGVLHFNLLGLAVFLVPIALVAAWLTHRTGSLWPAMLLHFLHNAAVVTLILFF